MYVSCVTQQGDIYIQCQGPGLQQLEKVADHIEEQYGKVCYFFHLSGGKKSNSISESIINGSLHNFQQ